MFTRKRYLGDAVYVEFDDFHQLILTTENGIETTNTIVLDSHILLSLVEFAKEAAASIEQAELPLPHGRKGFDD